MKPIGILVLCAIATVPSAAAEEDLFLMVGSFEFPTPDGGTARHVVQVRAFIAADGTPAYEVLVDGVPAGTLPAPGDLPSLPPPATVPPATPPAPPALP